MNGTPLTLLQPVEPFEKDLEQREDTSKCAYFGHHILTGTKVLVFCYRSANHVRIFIFQSIWNLTRNHFPKSIKRKIQQVATSCRNHLRLCCNKIAFICPRSS